MDFKKHMTRAWELTLQHIVSLVLMTLVMSVLAIVTLGVLAPVTMAGYMQSILLMIRDEREPKIQDLFAQMRLFLPLLAFGIVAFIAIMIGFMFLVVPGFLIIMAISFTCLYMLPLMTDKGLGLVEAVKRSYAMAVRDNISEHLAVAVLVLAISAIGGSIFIGFLFTQPLATIFLLSVYEEKTGTPPPFTGYPE